MIGKKERVVSLCDNCWVNEREREAEKEGRKEKYEMSVKEKEEMKEWQKRGEEC